MTYGTVRGGGERNGFMLRENSLSFMLKRIKIHSFILLGISVGLSSRFHTSTSVPRSLLCLQDIWKAERGWH